MCRHLVICNIILLLVLTRGNWTKRSSGFVWISVLLFFSFLSPRRNWSTPRLNLLRSSSPWQMKAETHYHWKIRHLALGFWVYVVRNVPTALDSRSHRLPMSRRPSHRCRRGSTELTPSRVQENWPTPLGHRVSVKQGEDYSRKGSVVEEPQYVDSLD